MADILITHSYHLPYDPKQLLRMQPYPPLGMLYAATALREGGLSVAAFDSMLEEPANSFHALLVDHCPRIVVVYEDDFNFLSKMCLTRMRQVAWDIAKISKLSGAVTIVHGSDSTDTPALFLENGFDYVLCGEAEASLCDLCTSILRNEDKSDIDGLVSLDQQRNIIQSRRRLAINPSWQKLSPPARDLIDLESYRRAWKQAHGRFSLNMVASRGCPYKCNWCAKPISGNDFHLRPAAAVADEMLDLKHRVRAEHIWFADDIFALDYRWVGKFADEVNRRKAFLPFKIQSRANLMTDSTVEHLRRAGCQEVWMGVESGSQSVLNAMDKGLAISSIIAARARLKRAGIRACYFLQFGYPGECWPELQETIALVRETKPDDIGVSFSYPLPGTVFYDRVRMQLGKKRNWVDSGDLCVMFKAAYKTEFYRAVRDALHAEVESWQGSESPGQTAAIVAALWRIVDELEPVSRQNDSLSSNSQEDFNEVSAFVPVERLSFPGEA